MKSHNYNYQLISLVAWSFNVRFMCATLLIAFSIFSLWWLGVCLGVAAIYMKILWKPARKKISETIRSKLYSMGLWTNDFRQYSGLSTEVINRLLTDTIEIDRPTATTLSKFFNTSQKFWLDLSERFFEEQPRTLEDK